MSERVPQRFGVVSAPRPRPRWSKVLVELSIRTEGNHRFARHEAVESLVGRGAIGAHVNHGGYEYEVVKARLVTPRNEDIGADNA